MSTPEPTEAEYDCTWITQVSGYGPHDAATMAESVVAALPSMGRSWVITDRTTGRTWDVDLETNEVTERQP